MDVKQYEEREELAKEDEHIFSMWSPLHIEIDKDYVFVPKSLSFRFFSDLLYLIICPILWIFNKVMFGFTIEGREHIKQVQGGKITIANHVHPMDCTMNALINMPHKTYFPTLKQNMEIPVINGIIRLLHAIPIPEMVSAKREFRKAIHHLLQEGETVHFYPEASLWPYYTKLRSFKKGAFDFAVENKVPIVPLVYTFHKPKGFRAIWKEKPDIKVTILQAVYPDFSKEKKEQIEDLKKRCHTMMEEMIKKEETK